MQRVFADKMLRGAGRDKALREDKQDKQGKRLPSPARAGVPRQAGGR